jgi:hypothetical protein
MTAARTMNNFIFTIISPYSQEISRIGYFEQMLQQSGQWIILRHLLNTTTPTTPEKQDLPRPAKAG